MTAPVRAFVPSPERAFEIAHAGGIRINDATKVQALIYAAVEAEADFRFIGDREHWITIRRLMAPSVRGDDFGLLLSAVAEGDRTRIQTVAEQLVNPS